MKPSLAIFCADQLLCFMVMIMFCILFLKCSEYLKALQSGLPITMHSVEVMKAPMGVWGEACWHARLLQAGSREGLCHPASISIFCLFQARCCCLNECLVCPY